MGLEISGAPRPRPAESSEPRLAVAGGPRGRGGRLPRLARSVEDLREALRQTTHGMERLMQAERLRRGTVEPVREPVRLAALVRSIVGGFAAEASGRGLQVDVVAPEAGELHCDPALLGLVLINLIGNAVKFSSAGVVRVTAEREPTGGWRFGVADEGPGIAGDRVERLFDAFVRGETHGQGGMGLGLSIASQAARLMGGRLTVESTVDVGSTFMLVVPDVQTKA